MLSEYSWTASIMVLRDLNIKKEFQWNREGKEWRGEDEIPAAAEHHFWLLTPLA
jgi:hypothetical protein